MIYYRIEWSKQPLAVETELQVVVELIFTAIIINNITKTITKYQLEFQLKINNAT